LGADYAVPHRYVLAILDIQNADSPDTRSFLRRAHAEDAVVRVPDGAPRSAVITVDDGGARRVYLSPISSLTLRERNAAAWR
jgi:hypothetical protein